MDFPFPAGLVEQGLFGSVGGPWSGAKRNWDHLGVVTVI